MKYKRIAYCFLAMALFCQAAGFSQTTPPSHPSGHHQMTMDSSGKMPLVVSIDGSKTPNLIPDATAYYHYFNTISKAAKNPAQQQRILSHVGMSTSDQAAFVTLMATFKAAHDPIEAETNTNPTGARFAQLQTDEANLVTTTRGTMASMLTNDGLSKVNQYVQKQVKSHTVMYTEAP